jgi:hypothetical protein
MASEPAYIRNFRKLSRTEPTFAHIEELERALYASTNDRATVVLFGSFVEANLQRLLTKPMRNLNSTDTKAVFEYDGVVGTFSAKITLAYALALIGPTTRFDLDLIRFLRNEFAHSRMSFGFGTSEVKAVCDQFKIVDLPGSTIPSGYISRAADGTREMVTDIREPKTRFIATCHSISYRMLVARHGPREGDFVFPNDDPVP